MLHMQSKNTAIPICELSREELEASFVEADKIVSSLESHFDALFDATDKLHMSDTIHHLLHSLATLAGQRKLAEAQRMRDDLALQDTLWVKRAPCG